MTYWPPAGMGYGAAVLFSPATAQGGVRWTAPRVRRFATENARANAEAVTVLLQAPVSVGGCIALGDQTAFTPGQVADVHEVTEFRTTANLFDEWAVTRCYAKPLVGQLRQTVTVYPVTRVETGRSYTTERGAAIYTGPGSVDFLAPGQLGTFGASPVIEYDATVTLPYSVFTTIDGHYEVDWNEGFGALTLDAQGPFFNNAQSPFWRTLYCKVRRGRT